MTAPPSNRRVKDLSHPPRILDHMAGYGWGSEAERVVGDLLTLTREIEPGLVAADDAVSLAEFFARGERVCGFLKDILAKRAEQCATWRRDGFRSSEEWFARMSGIGIGAAREQLELAAQVAEQPDIAQAARHGELSAAQTKEISKAAKADPAASGRLVDKAKRSSMKGLRDECRKTLAAARSAQSEAARHDRIHRSRYCRTWIDDDGAGRLDASVTPEVLATIRACLDPFCRQEFDLARLQGRRERHEAYAADALLATAQAANARTPDSPAASPGDDPAGDDPAGDDPAGDDPVGEGGPPASRQSRR